MKKIILLTATGVFLLLLLLSGCKGPEEPQREPAQAQITGKQAVVRWIMACRVEGEGFGCFPGDSAFVTRTGMACEALAGLGELDNLPDKEALVAWLRSRQQPDGGFLEARDYYNNKFMPWGSMSALAPTWWAVRTLKLLGAEPERPGDAVRFIRERQRESGAFDCYEQSWSKKCREAVYSTFWAVAALKELSAPIPDSARVVEWTRDQQNTEALRGGFRLCVDNYNYSSTSGAYYAVHTLALLGAKPERPEEVKKFLLSSYGQEADGGFELGHGDNWNNFDHYSLMHDTYMAVYTLELLGMPLADSDISRAARPATDCAAWIASVQNPDGGFARVGITDQTPIPSPSEMRATWQAVRTMRLLRKGIPCPAEPVEPANEVRPHVPVYRHPTIHNDDPAEVWAYRRIALPIYEHFLEKTGSRLEALGWLNRWARAVIGPENTVYLTGGRGLLMQGWGQCGEMSLMMQELASSVDHAARYSSVIGDVNCEILVQEDSWSEPHWCLFIPFTNEYPDPGVSPPDGRLNGWSVLDCIIDYEIRKKNLNYPSRTRLGDHLFATVRIETIDFDKGTWGETYRVDTTSTYESEEAGKLYPGGSW